MREVPSLVLILELTSPKRFAFFTPCHCLELLLYTYLSLSLYIYIYMGGGEYHTCSDEIVLILCILWKDLHLTLTSLTPKMTLIELIGSSCSTTPPVYYHMSPQCKWWFATLTKGGMMRQVGIVDLFLVTIICLHMICISCLWLHLDVRDAHLHRCYTLP